MSQDPSPFSEEQATSSFLDQINEDDEMSEDDNEDFWEFYEEDTTEGMSRDGGDVVEEYVVEGEGNPRGEASVEDDSVGVPVYISGIYVEDGEAQFELSQPTSTETSQMSPPRIPSGEVSSLRRPSSRRESFSPSASNSCPSSPTQDEPVVIHGRDRGRGGRGRGGGRRGAPRGRGGRGVSHRVVATSWKPGDPIREIYVTDDDVPKELRIQLREIISRRETRARRTKRGVDQEEEEFFDAEDGGGDDALFAGEKEATKFNWRPMNSFESSKEPFLVKQTGPTNACATAYDAFSQYWDEEILTHVVKETNRYAVTLNWSDWYDTNIYEIRVLLAFWIMLGIIRMPSIKSCFSTNPLLFTQCFRTMFSRQRYTRLCSCLNFNDDSRRTPESSPLFPVEPIISHLNSKFQSAYIPRQQICIDESLTLWKGDLSFRQYIKTKAAKFGIKTFELCESASGYLWSFFVYTDQKSIPDPSLPSPLLKSTATVLSIIRPLLNKGYTLFMDKWFNSPLLTRYLKRNKTDVVGSLRPNCQHVPPLITQCNLQPGQFVARHSGDMTVMAYYDNKKKVSLISTYHKTETAQTSKKKQRPSLCKPQIVLDYNANMGGIDLKDGMLDTYLIERKRCAKWSMKLFKRLLNASILNALICRKASTGNSLEHTVFRLELVEQILKNNLNKVPRPPKVQKEANVVLPVGVNEWHLPSSVKKRKADGKPCRRNCAECKKQGVFECKICNVGLCIDECFKNYHLTAMEE